MTCFALLKSHYYPYFSAKYAAVLTGDVLDESPAMRSLSIYFLVKYAKYYPGYFVIYVCCWACLKKSFNVSWGSEHHLLSTKL